MESVSVESVSVEAVSVESVTVQSVSVGAPMKLSVNWLPFSLSLTREVARRVERAGLWGMGIGDSPHYAELYAACAAALEATSRLTISTSVTNPVTRHVSVHASAARALATEYPGRFRLGFGRGDSAVRTFGLAPSSLAALEQTLTTLRRSVPDVPLLVAASGPAAARLAGRVADGVIAGVGTDRAAIDMVRTQAGRPLEVWASVRLAITPDPDRVADLRRRLVPRAVSASHFAFAATLDGKNVPPQFAEVLAERYRRYDYTWHGRSGHNPNAELFADHPEVEEYLVNRFAIYGTPEQCRDRLAALRGHVDGVLLSLLFEDVLDQVELLPTILDPADVLAPAAIPGPADIPSPTDTASGPGPSGAA